MTNSELPWWRQPLFHFLAAGAAIFLLSALWGTEAEKPRERITVTPIQIERLEGMWEQTWNRQPTEAELQGLVRDHIAEEVYYREALALGLDVNDPIVRRRMRQKMELLISAAPELADPDDSVLLEWFEDNNARYTKPAQISFDQVYLDDPSPEEIEQTLNTLTATNEGYGLSSATTLPPRMLRTSDDEIRATFGNQFAEEIAELPTNEWMGPIKSSFGVHLVRISELVPERGTTFEEVAARVKTDWASEATRLRKEAEFAKILERYEVIIESSVE